LLLHCNEELGKKGEPGLGCATIGRFCTAKAFLLLAVACLAAVAPAIARGGRVPGELVRLADGRHLNLRCDGTGKPVILFEAGFGAQSLAWSKVQALVGRSHRSCSYDRAGYGGSDPGPLPRDGASIARDLDDALRAERIAGPFVLVGHSTGGLYVRLFADRRPGDIAGMVLVDPSVPYQQQRFAASFGAGAGSTAGIRARHAKCLNSPPAKPPSPPMDEAERLARCRNRISELDTLWLATSDQVGAKTRSKYDFPVIVLTAGRTFSGMPAAYWFGLHDEVAASSTRGSNRLVADSSHMMMFDKPDAIRAAIEEVITEAGKAARR
jgi:pimeloyl-ACP methyl ester carboxylesterase